MGIRRAVTALAAFALLTGCGGTNAKTSTDPANDDPADPVMEQRLAVPQPRRPPPPGRPPSRAAGAGYARYFVAGALEYAMRSGFTADFRVDALSSARGRMLLQRIDSEYAKGHQVEMTPIYVDELRIDRGPFQVDSEGNIVHRRDPYGWWYWTVTVKYHVDELAIMDGDKKISAVQDVVFSDQLVVANGTKWRVPYWESKPSDPDVPILGGQPAAA